MAAKLASSPENCIPTLYLSFRPFLSLRLLSLSQTVSQFQRLLFFRFMHLLSPSHTFSFRYCFFLISVSHFRHYFFTHLLSLWDTSSHCFSVSNCLLLSDTISEHFPIALSSGKTITHSKPKVFFIRANFPVKTRTWMCFKVQWVQKRSPNINMCRNTVNTFTHTNGLHTRNVFITRTLLFKLCVDGSWVEKRPINYFF